VALTDWYILKKDLCPFNINIVIVTLNVLHVIDSNRRYIYIYIIRAFFLLYEAGVISGDSEV